MAILDLPVIIPINKVATAATGYHQKYRWYYISCDDIAIKNLLLLL